MDTADEKLTNAINTKTKGHDTDQDKTKRAFLEIWVKAVNEHGGFGHWRWAVARKPGDVVGILAETGCEMG